MSNYDTDCAEHMKPVGETRFVAGEADSLDAAGGPTIAGIVSHADLMLGDAVEEVLAAHDAAGGDRFRGIRHATGWDASDDIHNSHCNPFEHMMSIKEFRAGARRLAAMGFSFDAWLYHPQLPELAALAGAVPELTIVLDHLGGPLGVGPLRPRPRPGPGGLEGVDAAGGGLPQRRAQSRRHRHGHVLRHGLDHPGHAAGDPRRWPLTGATMCGSASTRSARTAACSSPTSRSTAQTLPYPVLWNALQIMAATYSDAEQEDLFSGTATRIYRLS